MCLWLARCLVFGFGSLPFHSISVRSGGVFVLAGAVGKAKISGVFLDMVMLVGAVFLLVVCFRSFFVSAAAVAPWFDFCSVRSVRPRFKYMFKYKFQVQVLLVSCDGLFRRRVCSYWYGEFLFGLV